MFKKMLGHTVKCLHSHTVRLHNLVFSCGLRSVWLWNLVLSIYRHNTSILFGFFHSMRYNDYYVRIPSPWHSLLSNLTKQPLFYRTVFYISNIKSDGNVSILMLCTTASKPSWALSEFL